MPQYRNWVLMNSRIFKLPIMLTPSCSHSILRLKTSPIPFKTRRKLNLKYIVLLVHRNDISLLFSNFWRQLKPAFSFNNHPFWVYINKNSTSHSVEIFASSNPSKNKSKSPFWDKRNMKKPFCLFSWKISHKI